MAVQNAENGVVRGHSRSWAMPPFDRAHLSKVADFDPPRLHLAPPYGVTPVEFRGDLWLQKIRFPGLSWGVVIVILRLAILVELRLVTDTDRHRPMASTADASRSKNREIAIPLQPFDRFQ